MSDVPSKQRKWTSAEWSRKYFKMMMKNRKLTFFPLKAAERVTERTQVDNSALLNSLWHQRQTFDHSSSHQITVLWCVLILQTCIKCLNSVLVSLLKTSQTAQLSAVCNAAGLIDYMLIIQQINNSVIPYVNMTRHVSAPHGSMMKDDSNRCWWHHVTSLTHSQHLTGVWGLAHEATCAADATE